MLTPVAASRDAPTISFAYLPAISTVSALFATYHLDTQPLRYLGHGPVVDSFNFLQGMLIAFGTPFMAWHTAINSRGAFRALVIYSVVVPYLTVPLSSSWLKTSLLWSCLAIWWAMGGFTCSSRELKTGLQWLGGAILFKIVELGLISARQTD